MGALTDLHQASTTALEAVFFISLSLTLLGSYYGLATPSFAIGQAVLSFALLLLLWPRGSAQLSFCTRSTYAKYKTIFLEFCALVYIACAALSLVARVRAKDYSSEVLLILLRKQAITTIGKLDLAACLAILASHTTGHHDICNRIHRRVLWLCWSLHKAAQRFCAICYEMLQEPSSDLEAQPNIAAVSLIDLTDPADSLTLPIPLKATPSSSMAMGSLQIQEYADVEEMDDADASKLRERLHLRRTLSSRTNPYPFMHQELRSIGARLRWSNLRYLLGFQKRPLQDVFLFVSSTSSEHHDIETGQKISIDPQIQLSPRKPRQSKGQNRNLRSVVVEMINRKNIGNHQPHPFDSIEHRHVRKFDGKEGVSDTVSPPVFQLPGTIQNMCVKALPDTGSSQNIIDKSLVQGLSPSVDIGSLDAVDKHLEAPDQEPIPCIGKVRLPWRFNNEEEQYEEWFHVVKDCSKGVILGNGFLQHTETMNKNRQRLEITEPSDPNPLPGNLVNETQQDDCLRELTRGSINGMEVFASLDTGSQANLISVNCAEDLGLEIRPLPTGQEQLKFANGRQVPLLGQVDVQWSFCDTPTEDVNVTLYVLRNCIHPVIFGDRFVYFQDPWVKHSSSLSQVPLETPNIGVVGLASKRRFWGFGTSKPGMIS